MARPDFLTMLDPSRLAMMQAAMPQSPTGPLSFLQRPGVREGLLAGGLSLLGSDTKRETFGQALGRSVGAGVEVGRAEADRQRYNEYVQTLPPQMQAVARFMRPEQFAGIMAQGMMAGPGESKVVGATERLVGPTGEVIVDALPDSPDAPELPTSAQEFQFYESLSPEQRAMFDTLNAKGPLVTVETGDRAANAAAGALGSDATGRFTSAAEQGRIAVDLLNTVSTAQTLLESPAAKRVTGFASDIRTLAQRAAEDPTAREIAAQFDIVTSDLVLQTIKSFKGALSDKELSFIERASAADRNMTVEELQAGLGLLRRIHERTASNFLDEYDAFDPAAFGILPTQMQQYDQQAEMTRRVLQNDIYQRWGLVPPPAAPGAP